MTSLLGALPLPLLGPLPRLARHLRAWPVHAQEQARRNAMVAATDCADRRADREEVDRFLAERSTARATGPDDEAAADRIHA
ncbi:hypothetical protein [Nocardioides sp. YIM 152588]|uniref:hypothetical protein n=1 Tax=Nocardioides sp. YIM 152588 TaxID=3158259 RepID=UPI0032E42B8E